jgi:nucleotide-binding universal stress UspA family protein
MEMGVIVVGVDGSEASQEALRFALRQAKLEGKRVRAVTAWHVPAVAYGGPGVSPLTDVRAVFAEDADAILTRALEAVESETGGVEIEPVVREGRPASVLTEAAESADLLVVGSRGLGGFLELLLGSVSHECAHHAPCPIVIVRGRQAA